MRGLQDRLELLRVTRERARHERCAELDGQRAGVDRRQIVDDAGLQRRAEVGGGRELPLGQPVAAVVFDDVDDRQVAAHQVDELADADGPRVAVAADADGNHLAIGDRGAGADRRHASVDGVEAVGAVQEVGRRLARAADARQLDDLRRVDPELEERIDDALGDRVVPAPGAQRRLAAPIGDRLEADAIDLLPRRRRLRWCVDISVCSPRFSVVSGFSRTVASPSLSGS